MNKKIIKAIVLTIVFFLSLTGFSLLTGKDTVELTSEMKEAALPMIYLQKEDVYINELYGHRGELNTASIRNVITPLSKDMVLPVTVKAFQTHVEGISYEVRTMDMQRLLQETQISDYNESQGIIETELQIQNLLEEEQEYQLVITLKCEGEDIRYYTRIIRAENCYVNEALDFVLDFHKKTFDKKASAKLATFLEPNSDGDNTTLQKVNINSSLNQVAWGDLKGEVLQEPVPAMQEISSSYNTITLNYVLAATGEHGETEFYNVEEYYRMRYSTINHRMYLLDYERTMNEIFRGNGTNISKASLLLGIRNADVAYMTNENATIIAFVQEGDLWSYNSITNQLALVYSFRGIEGIEDRENRQEYDIRIMKVNEAGSIDFVVYGHMNRGDHEGLTGVGVYHYDGAANTIQEEVFVQSPEVYQVLKETWGKLFYVGSGGYFYMLAAEDLYRIRLEDGSKELLQSGLTKENSAFSADGRYIAWREKDAENTIVVLDLETEKQQKIQEGPKDYLRPVGFVESDFVYGIANTKDTLQEELLLSKIIIRDKEQQVIKRYEKSGYYISDASVEGSTVLLERVKKTGGIYMQVDADALKSHEIEASRNIHLETYTTESKQTQVMITVNQEFPKKAPRVLTPKEVVVAEKNVIALEASQENEIYRVYRGTELILCTQDVAEAVQQADAVAGVVIDGQQQYIWRRGKAASASLTEEATFNRVKAELQDAIAEDKVLDLTGCSVSQVLYYVGQGRMVQTLDENQQPLWIVSYDEVNVFFYNTELGFITKKSLQDSEEYFADAGSVFITYEKE